MHTQHKSKNHYETKNEDLMLIQFLIRYFYMEISTFRYNVVHNFGKLDPYDVYSHLCETFREDFDEKIALK